MKVFREWSPDCDSGYEDVEIHEFDARTAARELARALTPVLADLIKSYEQQVESLEVENKALREKLNRPSVEYTEKMWRLCSRFDKFFDGHNSELWHALLAETPRDGEHIKQTIDDLQMDIGDILRAAK